MPVPSTMSDLDTNAANNSPPGTESAKGNIDNYLRAAFAFIKQQNNLIAGTTVTLASSSTVAIGAAAVNNIIISGTATITAFDSIADGALRFVTFSGAATLTHNATSLILPGAANITTAANDTAIFKSLGSGNWQCMVYQRASGAIVAPSAALSGALTAASATLTGALSAASGAFSGGLTAPTPATGNRSTSVATTQMFSDEFSKSLGTSGYQKLAGGFILQWGTASSSGASSGNMPITFPIVFPNALVGVSVTTVAGNAIASVLATSQGGMNLTTYTASTGTITSGMGFYYFVIGF